MSAAYARVLQALGPRVANQGASTSTARCPAHDDAQASLSVSVGTAGRCLLHCFAGCAPAAVADALGLRLADLFGTSGSVASETRYEVRDISGNLVAVHVRCDLPDGSKRFSWCRPGGAKGLGGIRCASLPLYGVQDLSSWGSDRTIILTEGEKACDSLRKNGEAALATVTGASSCPNADVLEALRGRDVILWPDFDDIGRAHMAKVADRLRGVASRIRMVEWGERQGDDAADFVARKSSKDAIAAIFESARDLACPPSIQGSSSKPDDNDLSDARPEFEIVKGSAHLAIVEAVHALAEDPAIFQRAGAIVEIHRVAKGGIARTPGVPVIAEVSAASLWGKLSRLRAWMKHDGRSDAVVPCDAPQAISAAVHGATSWPGLRRLEAVVSSPVLRADGTVLTGPGYDAASGLFLEPLGPMPEIPSAPTRDDARAAATEILDIVSEFAFASDADRSSWLSVPLTILATRAINGAIPMFLNTAPTRGSGKSLLADVAGIIATSRALPRMQAPDDDAEIRKSLLAIARAGDGVILMDNLPNGGMFGWPSLDAACTGRSLQGRILGKTQSVTYSWDVVVIATGNNLAIRGDSARRTIRIRLAPQHERPEARDGFQYPNLLAHVRREQPRLLRAALVILRAYIVAGRPAQNLTPFGSFEDWSNFVRAAIVWAGQADPVETLASLDDDADPEVGAHVTALSEWRKLGGGAYGNTISEIVAAADRLPELWEVLCELTPHRPGSVPTTRQLAATLKRLRGRFRVLDDGSLYAFDMAESKDRTGVARWMVRRVLPGSAGSPNQGGPNCQKTGDTRNDETDGTDSSGHPEEMTQPNPAEPCTEACESWRSTRLPGIELGAPTYTFDPDEEGH